MKGSIKKPALLFLALALLLPANKAFAMTREEKIAVLQSKGIVTGYPDGSLGLDRPIKRSEIATLLTKIARAEDAAQIKTRAYSDVPLNHWANGYIYVASHIKGMSGVRAIVGYPDGTFGPEKYIFNAEMMKIAVVIADGSLTPAQAAQTSWPDGWVARAHAAGIVGKGSDIGPLSADSPATRGDVFVMLYNGMAKAPAAPRPARSAQQPTQPAQPTPKPVLAKNDLIAAFNRGQSYDEAAFRNEFLHLINEDRRRLGLQPLTWADDLERGGITRCEELAAYGSISVRGQDHVRTDGRKWDTAFSYLEPRLFTTARGENLLEICNTSTVRIGKNSRPLLTDARQLARTYYKLWWDSPSHRENMMYPRFRYINVQTRASDLSRDAGPGRYTVLFVGSTHFRGEYRK